MAGAVFKPHAHVPPVAALCCGVCGLLCRYVLSYMESLGCIKRNQTVMQIGMGGGMKAGESLDD